MRNKMKKPLRSRDGMLEVILLVIGIVVSTGLKIWKFIKIWELYKERKSSESNEGWFLR